MPYTFPVANTYITSISNIVIITSIVAAAGKEKEETKRFFIHCFAYSTFVSAPYSHKTSFSSLSSFRFIFFLFILSFVFYHILYSALIHCHFEPIIIIVINLYNFRFFSKFYNLFLSFAIAYTTLCTVYVHIQQIFGNKVLSSKAVAHFNPIIATNCYCTELKLWMSSDGVDDHH